jgi:glycosyltransferase involved in cell wall biosynthesis
MARVNVPVALEVHDGDAANDPSVLELMRLHRPGPTSSFLGFVSISQTLRESLAMNGIPEEFITVAHDGIDPAKFSEAWAISDARNYLLAEGFQSLEAGPAVKDVLGLLEEGQPVIGYCGHFYPGRGIELLLKCAHRRPEWTFLLIGGFENDVEPYREEVRKQGLSNVIFTGYVANSRLAPFLWACDVLTMPYEAAKEKSHFMSPMKMFEYMATGRMIVAADWPQIREVLVDGRNALLHRRGDLDALDQAIASAVADEGLRERLAAAARADVEEFTWQMRGRRIVNWLEKRVAAWNESKNGS